MHSYEGLSSCSDRFTVHGEVLDFPGTITFAPNLEKARSSLANALVEMAETNPF